MDFSQNVFVPKPPTNLRSSRSTSLFTQPFARTNTLKYSYVTLTCAVWNTLPNNNITVSNGLQKATYQIQNAMGIDEVGPKIVKHCALALYKPIHHRFLLSLSQHYLPNDLRTHLIIPVFKSGDKSSVRNYHTISLMSKVLEKLIYNKIIDFVFAAISPVQFGFRPKHSATQQLLFFLSTLLPPPPLKQMLFISISGRPLTGCLIMNVVIWAPMEVGPGLSHLSFPARLT